jgi:acetoin utilization protein AcuB
MACAIESVIEGPFRGEFMKSIPNVSKFMTAFPHTIAAEVNLIEADKMMTEYNIRHLPVMQGGRLIGILSDRDVKLIELFKDVNPESITVEEACTPDPFIVSPEALLSDVCAQMASHKFGCALVVDKQKLVGIFTWVDALVAMNELLLSKE